ncbi:MAG: hypothetical protein HQL31_00665 [Planctomycetes bacterium]|nr:hypothetical protein [Planctomycetota bacterium]
MPDKDAPPTRISLPGILTLALILLLSMTISLAEDESEGDGDFFALPSPAEIIAASESQGLQISLSRKNAGVLKLDLLKLATDSKPGASFAIGRIFSIAGFSFKQLSNQVILQLASKVFIGMKAMKLPATIEGEMEHQYQQMLKNPSMDRAEIMISFTAARSSLMFLMKDPKRVSSEERALIEPLGTSLEAGLWFQSLMLAVEGVDSQHLAALADIFFVEDVIDYFDVTLKKAASLSSEKAFFGSLQNLNRLCREIIADKTISLEEVASLKPILEKVLQQEAQP